MFWGVAFKARDFLMAYTPMDSVVPAGAPLSRMCAGAENSGR